jgi:hydrogenase nickel incorporation protein HypA/HybF
MHELSLISNLFEILEEKAREKNARSITRVKLQVGLLSGAVPDLLKSAFDIYKKDTLASEAEMEIVEVPLLVRCLECGADTSGDDIIIRCGSCGSPNLKTIAGAELVLEKLELLVD